MTTEVIRVLVYTYEDEEAAQWDMARWEMPVEGVKVFPNPRNKCRSIESIIHTPAKRTARQQRVLDVANEMVHARNETARGVPTAAVIEPEEEGRIKVTNFIDTDLASRAIDDLTKARGGVPGAIDVEVITPEEAKERYGTVCMTDNCILRADHMGRCVIGTTPVVPAIALPAVPIDGLDQFGPRDPYRPATWLNPPPMHMPPYDPFEEPEEPEESLPASYEPLLDRDEHDEG